MDYLIIANSGSKAFVDAVSRLNARVNELQKMKPEFEVNEHEPEPAFDAVRERINDPSTLETVNTLENIYKGLVASADSSLQINTTNMFNSLENRMEKFVSNNLAALIIFECSLSEFISRLLARNSHVIIINITAPVRRSWSH